MHTRHTLANDLRALRLGEGDTVMVHASVRAVGEIAGGPDAIHLAIKDVVTEKGTVLMYAGCPQYTDEVGRGNLTGAQEAEVLEKLPPFDATTARSDRSNGALVELLRTYPGSRVNAHVARFAAWGAKAEDLLAHQPWNYAYGAGTVLDRFTALNGKILMLASSHDNVTYLHYAEHVADFPGKRVARFKVPVVESGKRVWREMEEFDTSAGAHANWPDEFFAKLVDAHLAESGNGGGLVGDAMSHLMRARELLKFATPVMIAVAADPHAADDL